MTNPRMFTGTHNDIEKTLSIAGWARTLGRSTDFVQKRLLKAEKEGMENPIAYVIEQSSYSRRNNKGSTRNRTVGSQRSKDSYRQEKCAKKNKDHWNMFLLKKPMPIVGGK